MIESPEHLIVDSNDLQCGICYSRYTPKANEPLILIPCEHDICSSCFKNIKEFSKKDSKKTIKVLLCPFCKAEISENPIRNKQLSSFLEKDSHVKKCEVHKQPMLSYCKKDHKLVCSQCNVKENPKKFGSIQEIHARMEAKRKNIEKIQEKKKEILRNLHDKISETNKNLKRKFDDLCEERLAKDLEKQKKLKNSLNVIMFTEKERLEHQLGLSKYEENYKKLQNWKNSSEENIIEKIFDRTLTTKQAGQFYNEKAKRISKSLSDKEKGFEKVLFEAEISENFFEKLSKRFHSKGKIDKKHHKEIAKEYLLNTLEDYGIVVNYQGKEDCFELSKSFPISRLTKFYPNLFECSIEKLSFSCDSISNAKFKILCELLQNTQRLSDLTLALNKPSLRKIELLSNFLLSSRTLQNFSFSMPLHTKADDAIPEHIQILLNSQRVSGFHIKFPLDGTFQQDLVLFPIQTKGFLEEFSAKFIGPYPLYDEILAILSGALNITTFLRTVKLHFGYQIFYNAFLQNLSPMLTYSHFLQELDLGFANVDELQKHCRGAHISQAIINFKELRKVSLFLAGQELSEDVFDDFFDSEQPEIFAEHKLEEFSLTIMECGYVDLNELLEFLKNFPQLKKLILRINQVEVDFQEIKEFLDNIPKLKPLVSFDFACRDFDRLTEKNKRDLNVSKCRLEQYKIQHKIVFEPFELHHLPDFLDFISDDDGEGDEENGGNEESEEDINEEEELSEEC